MNEQLVNDISNLVSKAEDINLHVFFNENFPHQFALQAIRGIIMQVQEADLSESEEKISLEIIELAYSVLIPCLEEWEDTSDFNRSALKDIYGDLKSRLRKIDLFIKKVSNPIRLKKEKESILKIIQETKGTK